MPATPALHFVLAAAHALASGAWFGSMFYSLTVMQPRAKRFFATDAEFEEFVAHVAQGARRKVLAAFGFVAVTGGLLIVVARPTPMTRGWLSIVIVKTALFAAAVAIFSYASWRLWPRRIFATAEELPAVQRKFRVVGFTLLFIAAISFALGILPHTW
jgi:putative copper export protein